MTDKGVRGVGMEVSRRSASGAAENAQAEGVGPDLCVFHCCDARAIRKHVKDETASAIVSNLPWGVRTGHNQGVADLQQLYEVFLRTSWYCIKPGARVVLLVLRGLQFVRILRKLGGRYRILKVFVVRTTNNLPCIVVAEKVGHDALHDSIKSQLSYMSQFVNISSEMYHSINMETIDEAN
jgi:23S rRNA G2445 N2-methylase RlmL